MRGSDEGFSTPSNGCARRKRFGTHTAAKLFPPDEYGTTVHLASSVEGTGSVSAKHRFMGGIRRALLLNAEPIL